ncbi:pilus assembly protein PilX [Azoarcus taiwanensis]|uniref:Pilus assembly protein PilX n=2 Tax=Azoarcus taiwanensis TaxID=666964 RepID=A0A972JAQ3_9RHOO|nr:pilus assembly protein PilX [Azoarcus taiwanensis]
MNQSCFAPPRMQRGTVLIVALIVLLLLTMLGLSSMRSTTLEERMAGNLRDQNLSFQAAESALREGEDFARLLANRVLLSGATDLASPATWNGNNPTGTYDINTGLNPPLAANPVYHVGPPGFVRIGVGAGEPQYYCIYRVTARGVGLVDTTTTILQSTIGLFEAIDDC